jgi:hypothetical protein
VENGVGERIFTGRFGLQDAANHISEMCNYSSIKDIQNAH